MDSLTRKMERVSYARILVEVDASKKLVDNVEFILPNGVMRKQPVVYEYTLKFYSDCSRFGHLKDSCQGPQPQAATPTVAVKQSTPAVQRKAQPDDWTMVQRRHKKHQGIVSMWQNQAQIQKQQQKNAPAAASYDQGRFHCPYCSQTKIEAGRCCTSPIPMKIGFWNVRDFNRPLKHNGVAHLIKNNHLCLLDILETKLHASVIPRIIHRSFPRWCQTNNFDAISGGLSLLFGIRPLLTFNPKISRRKSSTAL
ncbi:hypothetical protein Salat_2158900 [Sesamum alatum]|uniref:Uncharacterized protein n=1 Tax=Sesamum alatum TaxID=300844 RepID=A0AAE1Y1S7_9LAMI|nr:hypothetical protein Salat_2158900 [Sesamum alatum]